MSLILLWADPALAARVYWTAPPDPASSAAVARTVPDVRELALHELYTGNLPPADGATALAALRSELEAVRPLVSEFDGELQIMARLRKATSDVHVLSTPGDRDLLWEALVFEGFAVDRYFQDKLGVEGAAAPYRTGTGADAQVAAWIEACALLGVPAPSAEHLPEPAQRIAYDEAQAFTRSMPGSTFIVGTVAAGAEVSVDGVHVDGGPGTRVAVVPGRHLASVRVGDTVIWRWDGRVEAGADTTIAAPYGPSEHAAFTTIVGSGAEGWTVPEAAKAVIAAAGEPVYVATPAGDKTVLLRVDQGTAARVKIAREVRPDDRGVWARAAVGAGWLSSGDFFLENVDVGATASRATVNAGTPAISLSGEFRRDLLALGVGVDAQFSVGQFHELPTGESVTRTFLYPHVAGGLPWVQVTLGPLFPFYLGIGARAHAPLVGPVEGVAAVVYGAGIVQARGSDPAFEPLPAYTAWGGVAVRLR